nr:MAG TPA: hypothetical protein [Caudoviricetes sp.]
MRRYKRVSQALVLLLLAIALRVLVGLLAGQSMWGWIAAYWAALTGKNAVDFVGGMKDARVDRL